jgi:hypothetical protein
MNTRNLIFGALLILLLLFAFNFYGNYSVSSTRIPQLVPDIFIAKKKDLSSELLNKNNYYNQENDVEQRTKEAEASNKAATEAVQRKLDMQMMINALQGLEGGDAKVAEVELGPEIDQLKKKLAATEALKDAEDAYKELQKSGNRGEIQQSKIIYNKLRVEALGAGYTEGDTPSSVRQQLQGVHQALKIRKQQGAIEIAKAERRREDIMNDIKSNERINQIRLQRLNTKMQNPVDNRFSDRANSEQKSEIDEAYKEIELTAMNDDFKQKITKLQSNPNDPGQDNIEEPETVELSQIIEMLEKYVSLTENTLSDDALSMQDSTSSNIFISNLSQSKFLKTNNDIKFAVINLMRIIATAKVTFKNFCLRDSNLQNSKKTSLESEQDFIAKQEMRKNNLLNDFKNQKENFKKNTTTALIAIKSLVNTKPSSQLPRSDTFFLSVNKLFASSIKNKWIAENSKVLMLRVDSIDGDTLTGTELRPLVIGGGRVSNIASIGGGDGGGAIIYEPTDTAVTITGIPSKLKNLKRCSMEVYPELPLNSEQKNRYVFIKLIPNKGL